MKIKSLSFENLNRKSFHIGHLYLSVFFVLTYLLHADGGPLCPWQAPTVSYGVETMPEAAEGGNQMPTMDDDPEAPEPQQRKLRTRYKISELFYQPAERPEAERKPVFRDQPSFCNYQQTVTETIVGSIALRGPPVAAT